jgi:hypothetical protein
MIQYVHKDVLATLCAEQQSEPNSGSLPFKIVEVVASVLDNEVSEQFPHSYTQLLEFMNHDI